MMNLIVLPRREDHLDSCIKETSRCTKEETRGFDALFWSNLQPNFLLLCAEVALSRTKQRISHRMSPMDSHSALMSSRPH